jgi:hypothetical protein
VSHGKNMGKNMGKTWNIPRVFMGKSWKPMGKHSHVFPMGT